MKVTLKKTMPLNLLFVQKMMTYTYIWFRIALSYCVVGAVLTTLISAYLQTVNLPTISIILTLFFCIGVYKAELVRRSNGLERYLQELSYQNSRDI